MIAQSASKKLKLTPPRPSPRSTPETTTRRAVANGTTTAVPVSTSVPDSVMQKHNNVSVSRLDDRTAPDTSDPLTSAVTKPSSVEAKASSSVVQPQNSAVVAPALSHSAKV